MLRWQRSIGGVIGFCRGGGWCVSAQFLYKSDAVSDERAIAEYDLKLLVYDPTNEVIVEWID